MVGHALGSSQRIAPTGSPAWLWAVAPGWPGAEPRSPEDGPFRHCPARPHRGEPAPAAAGHAAQASTRRRLQRGLRSLLKQGLVEECTAPTEYIGLGWRQQDGAWSALRITDVSLRAIGAEPQGTGEAALDAGMAATPPAVSEEAHSEPPEASAGPEGQQAPDAVDAAPEAATAAPASTIRASLRNAAIRVLSAWDDKANQRADLADAMAALRGLLTEPAPASRTTGPRKPREGTKQQQVLGMLGRREGATVAQIAEATGWQAHTVRGFFTGLKKRGIEVSVLGRVRQVGPGKEGAKCLSQ
jgi:Protein of unknown function (DUF3489)